MINVCVIGYGRAGEAHARCYDAFPHVRVAAIVDPTPSRLMTAAIHFPHSSLAATLDDLEVDIDLVLICTPPNSHESYIERALLRGAHAFCEKPVFLDIDNGERLVTLASERRRIIHPGHNYKHSPLLRRLRELGSAGSIGHLQRLDIQVERSDSASGVEDWNPAWRRDPAIARGGIVVDHGPHCFYLAEWITGLRIETVSCTMQRNSEGIDEHAVVDLDMDGEMKANVLLSWRAPRRRTFYRLTGSRGTVTLTDDELVLDTVEGRRVWHLAETPGSRHAHDDWLPALAETVLDQVTSGVQDPEGIRSALAVSRTIASAYSLGHAATT